MDKIITAKDMEIQAETQRIGSSKHQLSALTTLKPLPEGRPIGRNTNDGTTELLGYLD